MRFSLVVLRKELLRLSRDRLSVLLWVGLPLVIGGLITLAMGGGSGPRPRAKLLIVDRDESFLSTFFVRSLSGQGADMPIDAELVEVADGRRRIDAGEASALLVLPEGFGEALLDETPTRLELVTHPAQRILPGIVEGMLELLSDAIFYVHRVFAVELNELRRRFDEERDPTDLEVAAMAVSLRHAIDDLETYLFPPAIRLELAPAGDGESQPLDIGLLFFPGVVLMALLFAAQGLSEDIWHERSQGTLRRLRAAPRHAASLLAGKTAAAFLAMAGIGAFVLTLGFVYHGLPWGRFPLATLVCAVTGTLLYQLMIPLQLFASSQRGGSILSNSLVFPLLMIGGSFFPMEAMPDWMSRLGAWTPNGHATVLLKTWLTQGSASGAASSLLAFLALSGLLFAISLPRLGGRFSGVG